MFRFQAKIVDHHRKRSHVVVLLPDVLHIPICLNAWGKWGIPIGFNKKGLVLDDLGVPPPFGKPLNGNMTPILTANTAGCIWMIIPKANFRFVFSKPNGRLIHPDLGAIIYRAHHVYICSS